MRLKYGNQKTQLAGETFDSKREAVRYQELKLMLRAGMIRNLQRQVAFELVPVQRDENGKVIERAVKYIADFTYTENGQTVVEDAKSEATKKAHDYIIKRKLMLYKYGIRIKEV